MSLDSISWKDLITIAIAAVGAVLGILNTWNSMSQRRLRIRVKPVQTIAIPTGQKGLGIEVINLSAFPITINDVGFTVTRFGFYRGERMVVVTPILIDGKPWPRRLEPRESVSVHCDPLSLISNGRKIGKAYAHTSCSNYAFGNSKALKKFRREFNL